MKLEMNKTGLAGEFRVVVKRADGTVKVDTGVQKNLFLDNGLLWYLGGETTYSSNKKVSGSSSSGSDSMYYLVLGSGNSQPEKNNIKLDDYIGYTSTKKDYGSNGSEVFKLNSKEYIKSWKTDKFLYIAEKNINISELGLASYLGYEWEGNDKVVYYNLITRSLIKQSDSPITISLLEGELLEVNYTIYQFTDITQQTGEFKLTENNEEKTYKYIFDYLGFEKSTSSVKGKLSFGSSGSYINTYGANAPKDSDSDLDFEKLFKEKISELRGDYSSNSSIYSTSTYGYSNGVSDGPTHERYSNQSIEINNYTKTITITSGVYSHIHSNGIRAILFYLGNGYSDYVSYIVVVWDEKNKKAIMKTNRHLWEATFSFEVSRWED